MAAIPKAADRRSPTPWYSTASPAPGRWASKRSAAARQRTIRKADCLAPPAAPEACDLIFLDPPYGQGMAVPALIALTDAGWIGDNALCMVEIGKGDGFDTPGGFEMLDERRYGAARVILLTRRAQTASAE
jgi:16S rRNA (guanine966-N2)-methyltransferase